MQYREYLVRYERSFKSWVKFEEKIALDFQARLIESSREILDDSQYHGKVHSIKVLIPIEHDDSFIHFVRFYENSMLINMTRGKLVERANPTEKTMKHSFTIHHSNGMLYGTWYHIGTLRTMQKKIEEALSRMPSGMYAHIEK